MQRRRENQNLQNAARSGLLTMSEWGSDFSLFQLPLTVDYRNAKIVEKKVLEVDPNKLKPGEVIIVKVT